MFEVGVVAQFEAAHRLRGDFGPAQRLHGHTYQVEVSVRGGSLREDGTLFDVGTLETALRRTLDHLNYRDLDEIDVFEGRNTTAEVVAKYVVQCIASALEGAQLSSVRARVWESPRIFAGFEAELPLSS